MRSLLFVPGDDERKLAKAPTLGSDAIIIDLEDSVAETRKSHGRGLARDYLQHRREAEATATGPQCVVRINALTTKHWEEDLRLVAPLQPDALLLPKSQNGEDVHRLSVLLESLETDAGLKVGAIGIIALASETALSLFQLPSYVGATGRLSALAWGGEDLSAAIGARAVRNDDNSWTAPFQWVRNLILFGAHAAGVDAIDTVFTDLSDRDGLERESKLAARDGFSGKLAVHPDQVAIINAAFTPPAQDIARAERIVALFAQAPDVGVVALDGEMIDRPHLERARRLLQRVGVYNSV